MAPKVWYYVRDLDSAMRQWYAWRSMSRRKRVSCWSTGRNMSLQLLGELDPVAVGIEDVEQTDVAAELDDDPDLDIGRS